LSTNPHGSTTRSVTSRARFVYRNRTFRRRTTADCNTSTGPDRTFSRSPHLLESITTALAAASASARNVSGNARTNFRNAAFASGAIAAAGPTNKNNACASAAVNPLRSVRAPPTNRHPPPRPACGYTGIPAADNASRSRRAVATEISSSAASSAAVTRPRDCINNNVATSRSARIGESLAHKVLTR
jgi:hypothetical protein